MTEAFSCSGKTRHRGAKELLQVVGARRVDAVAANAVRSPSVVRATETRPSNDVPPIELYVADLFAGAGGLTEGFCQASFTPTIAVEYDRWAAETYAANFENHILACPIEEVDVRSTSDGLTWNGVGLDRKQLRSIRRKSTFSSAAPHAKGSHRSDA